MGHALTLMITKKRDEILDWRQITIRWGIANLVLTGFVASLVIGVMAAESDREPAIKVMSFNIRYGGADDGENSWPKRDYLVLETIKMFDPDLLGAQEVLNFQADFLKENLSGYGFHGVGRNDGVAEGEFVPIFYRLDRFELVDSGHFWLSESPNAPGSKSWDSSLARMLSWVILRDREGNGNPFVFANTHFDHHGARARLESAKMIRQRAESIEGEVPVIIVGDFNTSEEGAPYAALVNAEGFDGPPFVDSYRVIYPEKSSQESSMSGWRGRREGRRIDWIIHSPKFVTLNAAINYTNEAGRYPSDHYPVQAILRRR
ncbi:MAG: hypothetical protein M2R45_01034 [Verrucomicrobia subdivision 3 bacterium]|nr:hypothetical protein [Limisphaerales bacterium]MCS1414146.1 hypothetical protein [Limisphaerales bacterium]